MHIHGKHAIFSNNTRIAIEYIGAVVYRLNGKVITTRNALHILSLWNPLISLYKYRNCLGCGVYLSYDVGSYILYPTFTLHVDDSQDNILSHTPLGQAYNGPIDYTGPHTGPTFKTTGLSLGWPSIMSPLTSTHPQLIPDENDDESNSSVPPLLLPSSHQICPTRLTHRTLSLSIHHPMLLFLMLN